MRALVQGGQALTYLIPVVLIFIFDKLFIRRQVISALIVVFLIVLLHFIGVGYFEFYIPECLYLLFGVFALEHYYISKDESYLKWVLAVEYITLFILIIISIPQFILSPNLTRMLLNAAEDPTVEFEYFWCISYRTVHELPVLSIPLFAVFKTVKNKLIKILSIVGLGLMFVVMVYASSTTSLLLMVAIYLFFIAYNKKKTLKQNVIKISLLFLLVLPFLNKSFTVGVIDKVVLPVFEGSSTSQRIEEIRYFILTGEKQGDMDSRENLYQVTINSILSNPLFPELEQKNIGEHSFLLDHLAAMGLFLFIPYIVFLYNSYRRAIRYIPHEKPYQIVATVAFLLLASFKNFFVFTTAMFIVPLFLILLEKKVYNNE